MILKRNLVKEHFFLATIGAPLNRLLRKLSKEEEISQVSYDILKQRLLAHFSRETHLVAARYKFYSSRMKPGQTHADWATELKGLAKRCAFECNTEKSYAESLIRDMLVMHTPEKEVRWALLQQNNPSLEDALKLATSYEVTKHTAHQMTLGDRAARDVEEMSVQEENWVAKPRSRKQQEKKSPSTSRGKLLKSCRQCFISHDRKVCRFLRAECYKCGKKGHIREVCNSGSAENRRQEMDIDEVSGHVREGRSSGYAESQRQERGIDEGDGDCIYSVMQCDDKSKLFVNLEIGGKSVLFQVDTGAAATLISMTTYEQLGSPPCASLNTVFYGYARQRIKTKGKISLLAKYKAMERQVTLVVVDSRDAVNILGMDVFTIFGFTVQDAFVIQTSALPKEVKNVIDLNSEVFSEQLGKCKFFEAHLQLKKDATPKFFKARPVPLAVKDKVKKEIDRLVDLDVLTPVSTSAWATPVVIVKKRDGKIRMCGDFKSTVNAQLMVEQFPIPRAEELFQKLAGGQRFSKIDLRDAYLQIPLDEESANLLVINTPFGLYRYNRLPFGVASAAAIFQRCLHTLTAQVKGSANYLDDIVVTGESEEEHLQNLNLLLKTLNEWGLRVNLDKCDFFKEQITYLGHVLDSSGIRPTGENSTAIQQLPVPVNLQQLQSFLGKINYYGKFIKNMAEIAAPLNALRKKGVKWHWSADCDKAFRRLKENLMQAVKLEHFLPDRTTILAVDASEYGIGAVLSQKDAKGVERPIACVSKTLNVHQKNYSQIEKEALAIVYGVRKFNEYLYGSKFIIITDHKPLVSLFSPHKRIPDNTARKMQRWALFLSDYSYRILYRSTYQHANADALSRLPQGPDATFDSEDIACLQLDQAEEEAVSGFPVSSYQVAKETKKDPQLRQVLYHVQTGWSSAHRRTRALTEWYKLQHRLSVKGGVLLLASDEGVRVVIPHKLRPKVLRLYMRVIGV